MYGSGRDHHLFYDRSWFQVGVLSIFNGEAGMKHLTPEEQERYELGQIKQRSSPFIAKPIAKSIRAVMVRSGLGQTQAAGELQSAWEKAAGPSLSQASRPGKISRGVLQVFVRDSSALQELHLQRRQVLAKLQQLMPQLSVRDIKGRIGL
jgi:hypothetical protein